MEESFNDLPDQCVGCARLKLELEAAKKRSHLMNINGMYIRILINFQIIFLLTKLH